jgi:twinkle protein
MTLEVLGPLGVQAMEKRRLNPETAARLGIYTGKCIYSVDGEGRRKIDRVEPAADGNILVFPIIENDVVVGEKYRGPNKFFFQKPGGKRTFINGDVLDDPSLHDGTNALTIVEGEPDLITAIDVGFPISVSVPDGAPNPPKERDEERGNSVPIDESKGKFEFLWLNRDRLKKIKRFIIAVDNDVAGKYLAEELVRRLGAPRCYFVTYPEGCKDLNEVLMAFGPDAVAAVLGNAKPYPLKGIYSLADYPELPPIVTFATGWATIDDIYKPFYPSFVVLTGLPGSGKSTWLTNLLVNFAELHGWKSAIFSPELPVVPHMRDKLRRIITGAQVEDLSREMLARTDRWINEYFVFIDHDVVDEMDEDLTVEWLIDRVMDAVLRYGVRVFVLDPWNEAEHAKGRGESTTEYINRMLRRLRKVANGHGLIIFVVAHPTKDVGKDGKSRVPTGYDIDGSAAWVNKPDFLIVVDRDPDRVHVNSIYMKKVRFEGTGAKGRVDMKYIEGNSRFTLLDVGEGEPVPFE